MEFLVFQLQAPMSSWGDTAVGEYRGSYEYPGESALIGLHGAAIGIRREDDAGHAALKRGLQICRGCSVCRQTARDHHTAQVPGRGALKGRPHATRRDELGVPKDDLNTILSTRDYRQDAASLVAVQPLGDGPYALEVLADRLRQPCFVLYLGRKSCRPRHRCIRRSSTPTRHSPHSVSTARDSTPSARRTRINVAVCRWSRLAR